MRAHVNTRTSATVATLVGWQVHKVNSLVFPLSSLDTAQPSLILPLRKSGALNRAQQGFIL